MKRRIFTICLMMLLVCVSLGSAKADVDPLKQKLECELSKMINAGHLRPGYFVCIEFYPNQTRSNVFDFGHHYFHNPADTIYTLMRALPLVEDNPTLYADLEAYIQSEWAACPPTTYTHMGWGTGVGREGTKFPAEVLATYQSSTSMGQYSPMTTSAGFSGWTFNPFNFYACWQYAEHFGDALNIYNAVKSKVEQYPDDSVLQSRPHVINSYIAGYIGYLNLEQLAGEPVSTDVQTWLAELEAKIVTNLATHARNISPTEAGGFLWLVPELGDYLHENALGVVQNRVDQHALLCPYWMMAFAGESTRFTGGTKMAEGTTSHLYEYSSLFQAKALALKENRQELELDLDVPRWEKGDLYYIQNLISTLEASEAPGESIKGASGEGTVTETPVTIEDPGAVYLADCEAAGLAAAQAALAGLGTLDEGVEPKLVLLFTSEDTAGPWGARTSMLDGVAQVFDANIVFGSQGYQSLSGTSASASCSVLVLAANDEDLQVHAAVAQMPGYDETAVASATTDVVNALAPNAADGQEQLLLIYGFLHTPLQETAVETAKGILGADYPIAGNASVPNTSSAARVYYEGDIAAQRGILGILLTGNFALDFTMTTGYVDGNINAQQTIDNAELAYGNVVGSTPGQVAAIFVNDHGGHHDTLETAGRVQEYIDTINSVTGGGIPYAGFFGGGEIGRYTNADPSIGVRRYLGLVALEKLSASLNPTAMFAVSTNYLTVELDASASSPADYPIVSYEWDFGDGNTDSGVTVSHTYAAEDSYTIVLTVTDSADNTGTASRLVSVSLPEVSDIGDLDDNGQVDFVDFAKLAEYWLTGELTVDIVSDGLIDNSDLAVIADNWMFGVPIPHEYPTVHYPLDGDVLDASPFANHGSIIGSPNWVADRNGNANSALHFNGSDLVNCGSFNPSMTTGHLTVAFWIYNEGSTTDQQIIAKRSVWNADMMWQVTLKTSTNLLQMANGNNPSGAFSIVAFQSLPLNTWTHVAITYDGETATCYLNGANPISVPYIMGSGEGATLAFGTSYQSGSPTPTYVRGTLDDIRIYDRGLTQAEVQALVAE